MYFLKGFLFEEMTTTIALIVPMFSLYTTAAIKYFNLNRHIAAGDLSPQVTSVYVTVAFLLPGAYIGALATFIALKAFGVGFTTFEQFKTALVLCQTCFGAYSALILSSLFEIKDSRSQRRK